MRSLRDALAASAIVLSFAAPAAAAPIVFSSAGANPAAIQAAVDAFRAQLGDPNNGATPGSQPAGRRKSAGTAAATPRRRRSSEFR